MSNQIIEEEHINRWELKWAIIFISDHIPQTWSKWSFTMYINETWYLVYHIWYPGYVTSCTSCLGIRILGNYKKF